MSTTLRFYGRRKGRSLSLEATQLWAQEKDTLLLREEEVKKHPNLHSLFPQEVTSVVCEIGSGYGEHLLYQMEQCPNQGFIAIEPFETGLASMFWKMPAPFRKRFRGYTGEAHAFLKHFPPHTLAKLWILFPDPWPKKRHHKRRLINKNFLEICAQLLIPGGILILASDFPQYIGVMHALFSSQTDLWRFKDGIKDPESPWPAWPDDWPITRYGRKALQEKRSLGWMIWERRASLPAQENDI